MASKEQSIETLTGIGAEAQRKIKTLIWELKNKLALNNCCLYYNKRSDQGKVVHIPTGIVLMVIRKDGIIIGEEDISSFNYGEDIVITPISSDAVQFLEKLKSKRKVK